MKLKALKIIYITHLKRTVFEGEEFETSKSHGDELVAKGMAEFVAESDFEENVGLSDYEQELIDKHTKELQESVEAKDDEITQLNTSITEKDAEIEKLKADISAKDEEILKLVESAEATKVEKSEEVTDEKDEKPAGKGKKG